MANNSSSCTKLDIYEGLLLAYNKWASFLWGTEGWGRQAVKKHSCLWHQPDGRLEICQKIYTTENFRVKNCRSLIKVKFPTDQFRPALGSGCCLIDWLWPCSKNLKTALFQTFSTWHPYTFCPYCIILTQYRLLVTQYHQVRVGQLIRHYQTETANSFLNQSVSFQNSKFWCPSCATFSQMICI